MKILILPGDGVGKEITSEALKVINLISKLYSLNIDIDLVILEVLQLISLTLLSQKKQEQK